MCVRKLQAPYLCPFNPVLVTTLLDLSSGESETLSEFWRELPSKESRKEFSPMGESLSLGSDRRV
jgi:hypothetical protein